MRGKIFLPNILLVTCPAYVKTEKNVQPFLIIILKKMVKASIVNTDPPNLPKEMGLLVVVV